MGISEAQYEAKIARKGSIHTFTPLGEKTYTSARDFMEALLVQRALSRTTGKNWHVIDGPKDWMTGKPNCYLIEQED